MPLLNFDRNTLCVSCECGKISKKRHPLLLYSTITEETHIGNRWRPYMFHMGFISSPKVWNFSRIDQLHQMDWGLDEASGLKHLVFFRIEALSISDSNVRSIKHSTVRNLMLNFSTFLVVGISSKITKITWASFNQNVMKPFLCVIPPEAWYIRSWIEERILLKKSLMSHFTTYLSKTILKLMLLLTSWNVTCVLRTNPLNKSM